MSEIIEIKKGLDIKLAGEANKSIQELPSGKYYAVKPTDFHGLTPKLAVKVGDKVKMGTCLFYDKYMPNVLFSSPVSGTVTEVFRGERRKILEIVIEADNQNEHEKFGTADPASLTKEQVAEKLLKAGLWPLLKQRPYGVLANPEANPKAIFISTFSSAPLAADNDYIVANYQAEFKTGIQALTKLAEGQVHLGINAKVPANSLYSSLSGVKITKFSGKHPVGNVGVQINKVDPINKGEVVWTLNVQDVVAIGKLFQNGYYDYERIVALAGSEVKNTGYYKAKLGTSIKPFIENNLAGSDAPKRFISGNVLTGTKVAENGYLGFYDDLLTVIPEETSPEVLGWIAPGLNKFSNSGTFLTKLFPNKKFTLNTRMHGNERAYVVSGQYEQVFPFDIYPVYLIKAIMAEDIEKMEQLGIYEVVEEDFALCEFVCTSKIEVQKVVREGLNLVKKELE